MKPFLLYFFVVALLLGCQRGGNPSVTQQPTLLLGADLSYVNEIEDCGASVRENGKAIDIYELFHKKGARIVRLRLWHNPTWTNYSNLNDVKKAIRRAKKEGFVTLLDFHYSDTWTDPGHQVVPKAWEHISDTQLLGDSLYRYTYTTLMNLNQEGLLPELVQVGNETNSEILLKKASSEAIHWNRNVALFNRGLEAVAAVSKETGKSIGKMLHIAQPENAPDWFENMAKNGLADYDWIGLSYYPQWSKYSLSELEHTIIALKKAYHKRVMIVETGYPYTLKNIDAANNLLDSSGIQQAFPATPAGQKAFMIALTESVIRAGAEGITYWEPAWVSSKCSTLWGQGTHWDNALFFDAANQNEVLPVFDFFKLKQYKKIIKTSR